MYLQLTFFTSLLFLCFSDAFIISSAKTHVRLSRKTIFSKESLLPVSNHQQQTIAIDTRLSATSKDEENKEPTMFEQVAAKGLAGILAITAAEAIFWALGVPLAAIYYKVTTGEWIDLATTDGQIKAAGFSFGYGGFATVILQYRVTLFAIPLVPIMEKYVVEPGKKIWGDKFGEAAPK